MKKKYLVQILLISFLSVSALFGQESKAQITSLTCEYLENPLGIDVTSPRFSWKLLSDGKDVSQSAYHILVASSPDLLERNEGDLWDTEKVKSDHSIHLEYKGLALISRQRCYWKAMVWDQNGNASEWSEPAWWEMALLDENDWEAQWIEAPAIYSWPEFKSEVGATERSSPKTYSEAAPYLRKDFHAEKQVVKARAYISGMGLYELSINGEI